MIDLRIAPAIDPAGPWRSSGAACSTCLRRSFRSWRPEELGDRIVLGISDTAEEVDALGRHPDRHLRREVLGHCRGPEEWPAAVLQPCGVPYKEPGRLNLGRQVSHLELDSLEVGETPTELLPLPHVGHGVTERSSAMPTICAPIAMRPSFRVSMAILYPFPTSPSTFSVGT